MSNLVLYRKYRPQVFNEFVGQEYVVQTITNAIVQDQVSHAYLFSGPHGTGKTTLARLLAKGVNCEQRKQGEFEPCGECSACREISRGQAIDLIEIDAASHRGIDDIRELRDDIRFVPSKLNYKVFIIDEAHQLTKDAFNALLKTLEEPPSHAIFVLATTQVHQMLPTIISRCQRFDFRRLTVPEIVNRLEFICNQEQVEIESSALELLAQNAEGSIRDGESLLDQVLTFGGRSQKIGVDKVKDLLGLVETGKVIQFTDLLLQKQTSEALSALEKMRTQGTDLEQFSQALVDYLRKTLLFKSMGKSNPAVSGFTQEQIAKLKKQAQAFDQAQLRKTLQTFLKAQNKMRYSSISQLPLELAVIELCTKNE